MILPQNKYPYIPPQADYDPGPPLPQLPPGMQPGPGPAPNPPFPEQIPPNTPGPQPPPLPFLAPPEQQVPPYGRRPAEPPPAPPPDATPPAESPGPVDPNQPQADGVSVTTYDPGSGQFLDPGGKIGVFAAGASTLAPAETWVDLMLAP